jgi:hypothetical protein
MYALLTHLTGNFVAVTTKKNADKKRTKVCPLRQKADYCLLSSPLSFCRQFRWETELV